METSNSNIDRLLGAADVPEPLSRGEGGFYWSQVEEPHALRRREMLKKHPDIQYLYGPCPRTKYWCTAMVIAQIANAWLLKDASWWLVIVAAYLVGGVINQSLLLAIHEISHNLAFKRPISNRLFGIFVNLPIGVPVSAAFRDYHLLHHTHQGGDGLDTDIPTALEVRFVKGVWMKLLWIVFQGFAYALRPIFMLPLRPSRWIVANFVIQIAFDMLIYYLWGAKALAYFPMSALIVMGLHPIAGHYISEHYVTHPPQETYSYYGPLNKLTFNVGYHNEHHDFPYIAGSRLPRLRALAPEYYESLVHHQSWTTSLVNYIFRSDLAATSRVKRAAPLRGAGAVK